MSDEGIDVLAVLDAEIDAAMGTCKSVHGSPRLTALRKARAAVAELIEADREYDAALSDWDHATAHDPEETSDETWDRVTDRFELAVVRRSAALARATGSKS